MLKLIYAGTPEFAVPALQSLVQSEHQIVAVYTQPDRPSGRGRQLQPGPVKVCAQQNSIPVLQPESLKRPIDIELLQGFAADLMIVAAYGLILPQEVLDAPRLGALNIHASLLPRWRGASPIQQAILAADQHTGVTLMKMEQGLDSGDIVAKRSIEIDAMWSAADLHDELAELGAELLMDNLPDIEDRLRQALPQDSSLTTYAPLLRKSDAEIDWSRTASRLLREIRAYNSWPVSYTTFDGAALRVWRAEPCELRQAEVGRVVKHDASGLYVSCSDAVIRITELQFAGRRRCSAAEAFNARDLNGCRFGN